ncbi:FAD-dependent oxidoreductase [Gordonia aichiensis]
MTVGSQTPDLAVVGGGVIGLTCALAAVDAGMRVVVHDAGPQHRASHVAGGMLGSLGEGLPGEEALLEATSESVARWPLLLTRLGDPDKREAPDTREAPDRRDIGETDTGATIAVAGDSLFVATTATDLEYLSRLADKAWKPSLVDGREVRRVGPAEIRELEGALTSRLRGGFVAVGEGAVDNRVLLARLRGALRDAGAVLCNDTITDLGDVAGGQVLLAAGAGVSQLLPDAAIHVAKGEILRLSRTRWSVPPPRHVVRARVDGRAVYLVPRSDGIVVGATQYESHEPGAEVSGVRDLLDDALTVMPGLAGYTLTEVGVGYRPCSVDGLPLIRRADDRVIVAAGHGRNGIVLAPYTAHRVLELLQRNDGDGVGGRGYSTDAYPETRYEETRYEETR